MTKQLRAAIAAILVFTTMSMQAQTSGATTPAKRTSKRVARKAPAETETQRELRELREQMLSQQEQINSLKTALADRDAKLATVQQSAQGAEASAAAANAKAETISSSVSANSEAVSTLNNTVTDLKSTNIGLAQTISDTKKERGHREPFGNSLQRNRDYSCCLLRVRNGISFSRARIRRKHPIQFDPVQWRWNGSC